jgi:hypothetical protein
VVVVQQGQAVQFSGRRHHKVYRASAAMLRPAGQLTLDFPGACVSVVVHGHPAEQGAHVLDTLLAVRGGAGAVEELQLGDGADRDQAGGRGLIPAERLCPRVQQPGQRARVDQELGRGHRR